MDAGFLNRYDLKLSFSSSISLQESFNFKPNELKKKCETLSRCVSQDNLEPNILLDPEAKFINSVERNVSVSAYLWIPHITDDCNDRQQR